MAKKIVAVVAIICLVAGISLLLFPVVSNFCGTQIANSITTEFDVRAENVVDDGKTFEQAEKDGEVDKEGYPINVNGNRTSNNPVVYKLELDRLYSDSVSYNENLKINQSMLLKDSSAYEAASLDLSKYGIFDGIYGYVSAPSIGIKLPIYLGASNLNMSYGAAHMTCTSLPIGGESTNTVIAGHTGYVGRIFFDNLRNLKIGDTVTLTNYWENLDYKVVRTEVKKPEDSQNVFISEDKDLLTMFTCIDNGKGGFDRYYVVCERAQ